MTVIYTKKDVTYKLYKAWILNGHAGEDIFGKILWAEADGALTKEQHDELFNLAMIATSYNKMLKIADMKERA